MPKILINEVDNTSAGTPGRYGNYAVLLAGFKGIPNADPEKQQKADENGVYEFNSAQAFKDTIGLTEKDANHAGNRMAYELLNLGYPVIYKVIENVTDMVDEDFWAIFRDRASYDFRFISHGLLTSETEAAYYTLLDKRAAMEADLALLKEIETEAGIPADLETFTVDNVAACDALFAAKVAKGAFGNFASETVYAAKYTYYHTAAGLSETEGGKKDPEAGVAGELAVVVADIEDKDTKSFTVGVYNKINSNIAKLASYRVDEATGNVFNNGRGDCVALIELDEKAYVDTTSKARPEALIIKGIKEMSAYIGEEGAYCALTVPSVEYVGLGKFPAAFHYLACFVSSLNSGFAEWYAVAGYNRGVSSYVIDHTSVKLGEIAINALEPRNIENQEAQPPFACNVIANFRGSYYLWGNRTAAKLGEKAGGGDLTAKHFLNIRQLCATLKKQLYVACRRFTFDPNSDTLWFNFVSAITPTLEAMKADQGIRDYKIIKVFTDKKATLKARVRIIPIEAVEDFDITVALEDSFGGVSVTAEG
jgi:hypothetical protein